MTAITESEAVLLFLAAGLIVWLAKIPPSIFKGRQNVLPVVFPVGVLAWGEVSPQVELLTQILLFFAKAGTFVFGSGLAIVPFLYGGVVKEFGWLDDRQFLDAVAVAMITPGPVVITVGFIGYLVAGMAGAVVAAIATFLPCYFLTILPAPYFKKHGKRRGIVAFVDGVTAAAVGAIAGSVIVLGRRTLFEHGWQPEWPKVAILLVTLFVLWRFKKIPEPMVVLGAAVIGLVIYPFLRS